MLPCIECPAPAKDVFFDGILADSMACLPPMKQRFINLRGVLEVMEYYDEISEGYDELHREGQLKKLALIKQYIKPKKTDTLLDIGCGSGLSSDWDCKVVGLDPSLSLLEKNPKIKVFGSGEQLPFKDKSFDYVVCVTALHNFEDVEKGLKEIKRVAKGQVVISLLKKSQEFSRIKELIPEYFNIINEIDEVMDVIYIME